MRFACRLAALALAAAAAGCDRNEAENVMAPQGNALDQADIDAVLGPEVTANDSVAAANELDPANAYGAVAANEVVAADEAAADDTVDEEGPEGTQ